ncbi:hypothetical protein PQQ51_29340 [Paraburkholderia xenovorans]|uniref:hypothetical protein n=1 Tax=Paraburkholderia xenovorans TaxID=36873 RepID=UPI0038B93535
MVVGLVLAEVAFTAYLLSPKSDPQTNEPGAAAAAAANTQSGATQVSVGNNANASRQDISSSNNPAAVPSRSVEGHIEPPVQPITQSAAQAPRQKTLPVPKPAPQPVSVAAASPNSDTPSAARPQFASSRDNLHRHDPASVSSSATDQLVKESSKLDPALPPPEPFVHTDQQRRGTNTVAAAMTDQLVRESAKLDPALPPPNPSGAK